MATDRTKAWGLLVTIALHGGIVAAVLLYRALLSAAPATAEKHTYVTARLIRGNRMRGMPAPPDQALGKQAPQQPRLPDKEVPALETQKEKTVGTQADPTAPPKPAATKDERPTATRMQEALRKAQLLNEGAEAIANEEAGAEGFGVPYGTSSGGSATDMWWTQLADLWDRTHSIPTIISPEDQRQLFADVIVRIDREGTVQLPITIVHASGNTHFDASIVVAWNKIHRLPLPPADLLAQILADGLKLRIRPGGLQ